MKIVVTGALGHIGSRLVHAVRPGEYSEVVMLDDLSTQRFASLFNLPSGVTFRFHEEDILTSDLERRFEGAHVVVHLAAITNAPASFNNPEQVERVNYDGTARVARACAKTGSRLIYLSTTSVYGTQKDVVDEDCSEEDLKPQSPYAQSKIKGEQLLTQLGREQGLRFVSCRFGTIFGPSPGMRFHTAVNKFIWQACFGLPVTVWRTAYDQKRPYLDLADAVRAVRFIIEKDLFRGGLYNVVTLNETVRGITDAIRRHVPGLQIQFVDSQIMNQLSYNVSAARFEKEGFAFRGDLDRAVAETVALLKNAGAPEPPR